MAKRVVEDEAVGFEFLAEVVVGGGLAVGELGQPPLVGGDEEEVRRVDQVGKDGEAGGDPRTLGKMNAFAGEWMQKNAKEEEV